MIIKSSFSFAILIILIFFGCERQYDKHVLIGTYELIVGTNQKLSNKKFLSSQLILNADGSSLQICTYKDEEKQTLRSTWNYDKEYKSVWIDNFEDCAAVWPVSVPNSNGAHLPLEFSSPIIILLDPDINIYYEKVQ